VSRPFADLEAQFQGACDAAVETCRTLTPPYIPTVWIKMSRQLGAAEAARRLVVSGDIQTGFDPTRSSWPTTADDRVFAITTTSCTRRAARVSCSIRLPWLTPPSRRHGVQYSPSLVASHFARAEFTATGCS
jgi:hypothetical protein